jgi:hypothetical protein
LRCDVPIFPNLHEQLTFREIALKDPSLAIPPDSVVLKLKGECLEDHGFGTKKMGEVNAAISTVGKYWMRPNLWVPTFNTLDDFLGA